MDFQLRAVETDSDLIAFQYDFGVKAVEDAQTLTVAENGDLIIEGYAAVFEGLDREGENFADGAFERGIKSFLSGQAGLCYHHKHDMLLGKVLDLRQEEGKGLWMRARVDGECADDPALRRVYHQIKKGTMNALSVGGFFKRALTEAGRKIVGVDFTEISVTPVPVHSGTNFAVVAGKALMTDVKVPAPPQVDETDSVRQDDVDAINFMMEEMDRIFRRIEDSVNKRRPAAQ